MGRSKGRTKNDLRDRPASGVEVLIVLVIVAALLAVFVTGCTYTRGPCTFTKEVTTTMVCEADGRVFHTTPFTP